MEQTTLDRDNLEVLASVAHAHALAHDEGGAGLCLPVAAALGWVLRDVMGVASVAVSGSFDGEPHWWLEVDGLRVDPTRHQFDDRHDLVYAICEGDLYVAAATYPSAWTRDLAVAEAVRAFAWPAAAHLWVMPLLDELEAVARIGAGTPECQR